MLETARTWFLPALLGILAVAAAPGFVAAQSNDQAVEAAKKAAQDWLALLDADEYEATWAEASPYFKSKISAAQWESQLKQAHASLDSLRSRSLVAARYTTSFPNAPDGEYVVAQYEATYGDQRTVETVTLKKGADGWGVAGYFIKPANQE